MKIDDYNFERLECDHLYLHQIVGFKFICDSDLEVIKKQWEDDHRVCFACLYSHLKFYKR